MSQLRVASVRTDLTAGDKFSPCSKVQVNGSCQSCTLHGAPRSKNDRCDQRVWKSQRADQRTIQSEDIRTGSVYFCGFCVFLRFCSTSSGKSQGQSLRDDILIVCCLRNNRWALGVVSVWSKSGGTDISLATYIPNTRRLTSALLSIVIFEQTI